MDKPVKNLDIADIIAILFVLATIIFLYMGWFKVLSSQEIQPEQPEQVEEIVVPEVIPEPVEIKELEVTVIPIESLESNPQPESQPELQPVKIQEPVKPIVPEILEVTVTEEISIQEPGKILPPCPRVWWAGGSHCPKSRGLAF